MHCGKINKIKTKKKKISWDLWKGNLAIGGGAAAAMAIVASPSMGDHRNYVHLLYGNGKLSITVRV
jgi:hypothetical protein